MLCGFRFEGLQFFVLFFSSRKIRILLFLINIEERIVGIGAKEFL